ncbi:hypothetical protein [uncultured Dubosiella sp.]|uniref:hypothetical protein n=1 Tax=uncultured Dubosiella sp. TaxID=1937011 RepID=UPI0022C3AC29|nr:hypothetical protein [uncultured Dubosiella sp.]MCZ2855895.1 hypothetical protein [Candidatus Bathyarchaeota archaeon]
MNDIAPELLQTITNEFEDLIKNDEVLFGIRKKIKAGKATYQDANRASIRIGELLSKAYRSHLSSDVLPDGTMYYNIAKRVLEPTLKRDFEEVSGICQDVQQLLNQKANIGIKAVAADLNQDRIDGIIDRVSSAPYKKTQWMTKEPVVNFSQSIVDDHIKANADFHAKAGLSPKIVRRSSGKCCEWCSKLVGTYRYPEEAPDGSDVWRRHNNCRCTVDYDPGEGKVQDVWSKKWKESEDVLEYRKRIGLEQHKDGDKVFITEQAIQKIRPIYLKDYTDENVNFSFQIRKELLEFAREKNNSDECACIIDLINNRKSNFITGDKISVDIFANPDIYHLIHTSSENTLELTHNHPGLSDFSANDINIFMKYRSIKSISIVTNQGKTLILNKTNRFDLKKAGKAMNESLEKAESIDQAIENFLKKCYSFGVERK